MGSAGSWTACRQDRDFFIGTELTARDSFDFSSSFQLWAPFVRGRIPMMAGFQAQLIQSAFTNKWELKAPRGG